MKFVLLTVAVLVATLLLAVPIYLGPNDLRGCDEPEPLGKCAKVDAIVTVSGGDTAARTLEAITLYKAGWAPILIFSGAAADKNGPSNAEAMQFQAIEAGVPESAVITEEFSRTTDENAANTSQFINARGLKRIILVTSAYHQRRAALEFGDKLGEDVVIVNHPVANDKQWRGLWWWTSPSGWWLAGSETIKVLLFYVTRGA